MGPHLGGLPVFPVPNHSVKAGNILRLRACALIRVEPNTDAGRGLLPRERAQRLEKRRPVRRATRFVRSILSPPFSSKPSCAGFKPPAPAQNPDGHRAGQGAENREAVAIPLASAGPSANDSLAKGINHLEGRAEREKFHVETLPGVLPRVDHEGAVTGDS